KVHSDSGRQEQDAAKAAQPTDTPNADKLNADHPNADHPNADEPNTEHAKSNNANGDNADNANTNGANAASDQGRQESATAQDLGEGGDAHEKASGHKGTQEGPDRMEQNLQGGEKQTDSRVDQDDNAPDHGQGNQQAVDQDIAQNSASDNA